MVLMSTEVCFVMQPFDNSKFDQRFEDVFKPALESCSLEVYRVDRDPGVIIPIEEIEKGIRNSRICFAEITTDNPNVWYELGYAIACGKDVVIVCSDERSTAFPFDIRHRSIIKYDTNSLSSFAKLEADIVARTRSLLKKRSVIDSVKTSVIDSNGLTPHEVTALITVMINSVGSDGISTYSLKEEMRKNGYTDAAISVAITKLLRKGMIDNELIQEYQGEYYAYKITEIGEDWVLENEEKLVLVEEPKQRIKESVGHSNDPFLDINDDDLPF